MKSLFERRPADFVKEFFGSRYMLLVNYSTKHRRQWMDQVTRLHADRRLLLNHCEACQLISTVKATAHVPGQIAELGVAYGGSAKLIAKHSGNRKIHLFDTFAGLPEPTIGDSAKFSGVDFMTSTQEVQNYLRDVDRQQFVYHKGYFPETASAFR